MLRFMVRQPLPPAYADTESIDQSIYWTQNPHQYQQVISNASNAAYDAVTKDINTIFRETYSIDYARLISDKKPIFFLCFFPAGHESYEKDPTRRQALRLKISEEHDLMVNFLHENGAEVFSIQDVGSDEANANGSWDYFSMFLIYFQKRYANIDPI